MFFINLQENSAAPYLSSMMQQVNVFTLLR